MPPYVRMYAESHIWTFLIVSHVIINHDHDHIIFWKCLRMSVCMQNHTYFYICGYWYGDTDIRRWKINIVFGIGMRMADAHLCLFLHSRVPIRTYGHTESFWENKYVNWHRNKDGIPFACTKPCHLSSWTPCGEGVQLFVLPIWCPKHGLLGSSFINLLVCVGMPIQTYGHTEVTNKYCIWAYEWGLGPYNYAELVHCAPSEKS